MMTKREQRTMQLLILANGLLAWAYLLHQWHSHTHWFGWGAPQTETRNVICETPAPPPDAAEGSALPSREPPTPAAGQGIRGESPVNEAAVVHDAMSVPLPEVTEAEVEKARRGLEAARNLFGGHYQPFDGFDLGPRELAMMTKLTDERKRRASEIAGREDAGELTHEEAMAELQRIDEETASGYQAVIGRDKSEVWLEETQAFTRDEGLPAMEQLWVEAKRKLDEESAQR